MIRVGVLGALGRMGAEVCRAVASAEDMTLAAAVDARVDANRPAVLAPEAIPGGAGWFGYAPTEGGLEISNEPASLRDSQVDVAVDFTTPSAAPGNIEWCVNNGIHVVVGTTGISEEDLSRLGRLSEESKANIFLAPNFAIGAVLMMRFAEMAAEWLPDAEIIELHHPGKLDSPSGTSLKTAEGIGRGRQSGSARRLSKDSKGDPSREAGSIVTQETLSGARGADHQGVHIHSVRLPGLVAHQQVLFGGQGETLAIRHDSMNRTCFMPGVLMAIREIDKHPGLTVGLEHLLGL